MKFEELESLIIGWANDKNILNPESSKSQLIKLFEEQGELCHAFLKNKQEEEIDAIGDIFVVLIIYCGQRGLNPVKCLNMAYNEIKNRTGKTVNGTFIKDE